ncbi:MAG: hypothetical protein RLZZ450_3512 [Pseudomonadota bacterium]|jgi:hypothetical protein
MDIRVFSPVELAYVLRALRNVALSDHHFSEGERALIEGIARIHEVELALDTLEPIAFEEVARVLVDPQRRKRAVQLAIVMSLVEGTPSRRAEQRVSDFARALGIEERGLSVLSEISHGHALLARFDMLRRFSGFIRRAEGFPGFWKVAPTMLGIGGGDPELAARYHALEGCAAGTLGRAVYDHFRANDFKFPGELGGMPLPFHDIGHVLAGYGTDPQSEIQQAAFQAGFARRDGFTFLLFGIMQFHLGLKVTPVAEGHLGLFDVPRVMFALGRGAACKVDFTQGYDLFADQHRPLDEVRRHMGIPPLEHGSV